MLTEVNHGAIINTSKVTLNKLAVSFDYVCMRSTTSYLVVSVEPDIIWVIPCLRAIISHPQNFMIPILCFAQFDFHSIARLIDVIARIQVRIGLCYPL